MTHRLTFVGSVKAPYSQFAVGLNRVDSFPCRVSGRDKAFARLIRGLGINVEV